MNLINKLIEIYELDKSQINDKTLISNIGDEELDKYSVSIEKSSITIDATNRRSYLYAIYDILTNQGVALFESDLVQRGVHLDCGRKYFTKNWIKELIKYIFTKKLNTLQLHFSENEGLRIKLPNFEYLASEMSLELEEVLEILDLAKDLEINIIPSFDSPGHLKHILNKVPQYKLKGLDTGIDITNFEARAFIKDIYSSILTVFRDTKSFHIGGDEFIDFDKFEDYPQLEQFAKNKYGEKAQAIDAYIDYINDLGAFLLEKNINVHVWNDPFYRINQQSLLKLNQKFDISYWTSWNKNMAPVNEFINAGHNVINYMDSLLYFVLGENAGYTYPTKERIMNDFKPNIFPDRNKLASTQVIQDIGENSSNLKGSMISIWCDRPEALNEQQIKSLFFDLIDAFIHKCTKTIKSS